MSMRERFLSYIKIDTQSDPYSDTCPSSDKQLVLSRLLFDQLKDMGLDPLLKDGYVYASIDSNLDKRVKSVGFIAHVDTSFDFSGFNVKPRVISNYDGSDIYLNDKLVLDIKNFSELARFIGDDIVVTDGSTLLGADDKAGVTIIMEMVKFIVENPMVKHGDIKICFTPDEEIGRGADLFDIEYFGADFAYTIDGGLVDQFCYETFNAYALNVDIKGVMIHPGSGKDKLVNAIGLGNEFDSLLPKDKRPEFTSGYEGFNHLVSIKGSSEYCHMEYIVRNHSYDLILKQLEDFERIRDFINSKYGYGAIVLDYSLSYRNMFDKLKDEKEVLDIGLKAIKDEGMEVKIVNARGGTDGSRLTFMGLPCPNIGTGGINFHGPYECCSLNQMEIAKRVLLNIIREVSK